MLSLSAEFLILEGVRIPKYGSITLQEYLFLREYFATPKPSYDGALQLLADFQQRQILATLLLISRSSPTWTLAEVTELFTVEQVYALSDWLMGEWLRWKTPAKTQDTEGEGKQVEIDWEAVYWRLQLWYPGHPQFSTEDAFLRCPLTTIEKACDIYMAQRRQELHLQELGLATLTAITVNCHKSAKSRPSKPSEFFYFASDELLLPSAICNGFWLLAQRGLIPNWAIQIAPVEDLKTGRSNAPTKEPAFWIGEQIVLIAPEVWDQEVSAPLALIDCSDGYAMAYEPAENTPYQVEIPEECRGKLAVVDFVGKLS